MYTDLHFSSIGYNSVVCFFRPFKIIYPGDFDESSSGLIRSSQYTYVSPTSKDKIELQL